MHYYIYIYSDTHTHIQVNGHQTKTAVRKRIQEKNIEK